jgi:hypothetical protein
MRQMLLWLGEIQSLIFAKINLINIFLSMGVGSIQIFNNFLRALDSTWNFYYEGWIHTNSLENSLLKLVFFHGLRIYIYMSRIAESYGLAYIFIYITWITNIERDYWVSTVTVNASSSSFWQLSLNGFQEKYTRFPRFSGGFVALRMYLLLNSIKKLQIIRISISLKTNNICLLIQIHHLQIIQKKSSSSNPHSLTSNTS